MRRLHGLVHPEAVVTFYKERLRSQSAPEGFEQWVAEENPGVIDFSLEDCLLPQREPLRVEITPTVMSPDGETELNLHYRHTPPRKRTSWRSPGGAASPADWFGEWLVAGWLAEKVSTSCVVSAKKPGRCYHLIARWSRTL